MHIAEPELNYIINIRIPDYHVGDCFLAVIMMYIDCLCGESSDLLQFAWFFAYSDVGNALQLVDFEEIHDYVRRRYGISFGFLRNYMNGDAETIIMNELKEKRPVGLTVDYRYCPWAQNTYREEYTYHFVLVVGYTEDEYLCVDNETNFVWPINKKKVHEMTREMLLFKGNAVKSSEYNCQKAFLSKDYMYKRRNMNSDLDRIATSILRSADVETSYFWSSKLRLISYNYSNFGLFLEKYLVKTNAGMIVDETARDFRLLSLFCLKLYQRRNVSLLKKFMDKIRQIKDNEVKIRLELEGATFKV